jgi:hypothetical protein
VPRHRIAATDRAVAVERSDQHQVHTATGALIAGAGS